MFDPFKLSLSILMLTESSEQVLMWWVGVVVKGRDLSALGR